MHAALRALRAAAAPARGGEAAAAHGIVVNLQGDEPLASPAHVDLLVASMRAKSAPARPRPPPAAPHAALGNRQRADGARRGSPGDVMATIAAPLAARDWHDPHAASCSRPPILANLINPHPNSHPPCSISSTPAPSRPISLFPL